MSVCIVRQTAMLRADDVAAIAAALQIQAVEFCTAHNLLAQDVHISRDGGPERGAINLLFTDDPPPQPGVLAWHYEDGAGGLNAVVPVKDAIGRGIPVLRGDKYSIGGLASHEMLETLRNPFTNQWVDHPEGGQIAAEVADPVEGSLYEIAVNGTVVSVSDWVRPTYFDPHGVGPFDKGCVLSAPFSIARGGYAIRKHPDGSITYVFGEEFPEWRQAQVQAAKHGRLARMLARLEKAVGL